MKKETNSAQRKQAREDLRAAYESLPQMLIYEAQKQWSATSVFIQFSVAMIVISLAPPYIPDFNPRVSGFISLIISILGFMSSLIWMSFILRYEKISKYWFLSIIEVEKMLSNDVGAFERRSDFSKGKIVKVLNEKLKYQFLERFPERWGLVLVYAVFVIIFIGLVIVNLLRLQ